MIVTTLIASILAKMPHTLTSQDILDFINDVESQLYSDTVKEFTSTYIPLTANLTQYSFPTGVTLLDTEVVFLNGTELPKRDLRQKNWRGYYKEGDKLTLSPVPAVSDTSYVSGAGEITFGTATITTTGADFTGVTVGDTILISGATTTANNKYAVVISVAAKVLTFPASTFTAGADAAVITVYVPALEVISRYKPAVKLIANIATDTLALPDSFIDLYRYYCYAQIAALRENFDISNNWNLSYRNRLNEFRIYYSNNSPRMQSHYNRRW